jgi:hypothetical protein
MMIRQTRFPDSKRAPHQRLRIRKTVRGLKQRSQIVQADGHLGMIRAEACLVYR